VQAGCRKKGGEEVLEGRRWQGRQRCAGGEKEGVHRWVQAWGRKVRKEVVGMERFVPHGHAIRVALRQQLFTERQPCQCQLS